MHDTLLVTVSYHRPPCLIGKRKKKIPATDVGWQRVGVVVWGKLEQWWREWTPVKRLMLEYCTLESES